MIGSDAAGIAAAFDLGQPLEPLRSVQASVFETSQLTTTTGRYVIKRLWQGENPSWWREHQESMRLERLAIEAGIRTPMPVVPFEPTFGWAARVEGFGVVRAYEWVEHRALTSDDDITGWFGRTLSTLHRLRPLDRGFTPEWRWLGVYPRERWEAWIDTAVACHKPWGDLARRRLADLVACTARVRHAHRAEHVLSHRDVGPWNVLVADDYLLIDWEGAGPVLPSCETGRAIQCFSHDDLETMRRLRDAYLNAGGVITCAPQDFMLDTLTDLLGQITERIRLTIGDYPDSSIPVWLDPTTADDQITTDLERFPAEQQRLSDLGTHLLHS